MRILVIGSAPFKPLEDLTRADFLLGLISKTLGQIGAVQAALKHVSERGSITVTTGVLARDPIMDDTLYQDLVKRARDHGINARQLVRIPQVPEQVGKPGFGEPKAP